MSGSIRDPQRIVNELLAWFGADGFANVKKLTIVAAKLDSDSILPLEGTAQAFPAQVNVAGFELKANSVEQVVVEIRFAPALGFDRRAPDVHGEKVAQAEAGGQWG